MWTLTSKKTGDVYYLLPEKEKHTVGRANADLILTDDTSISRSHACLYVSKDFIKVIDVGSKYGTFYNENIENKEPMQKNVVVELKNGERIKFGMFENEWVLSKMNICTLTSTLTMENKSELQDLFTALDGIIVEQWAKNCTHLTMSEITVTHKVLQALVENIPIVKIDFWRTYLKNLRAGQPPPKPVDYLPKCAESFINRDNVSFSLETGRKTIFAGKNFVFMSSKPFEKYKPIIESAGGTCGNLYKGVTKNSLNKKNVIVIRAGAMSQTQNSQAVESIHDFIKSKGRRLVPEVEIGLAILHCSTAKYCNPDYNVVNEFAPETNDFAPSTNIIAKHTPFIRSENFKDNEVVELPESLVYDSTQIDQPMEVPNSEKDSESVDATQKFEAVRNQTPVMEKSKPDSLTVGKRKRLVSPGDQHVSKKLNSDAKAIEEAPVNPVTMSNGLSENLLLESSSQSSEPAINVVKPAIPSTSSGPRNRRMVDLSKFMDTSQIVRSQPTESQLEKIEEQASKPDTKKRARIAAICSDDDDDDLFAFDSTTTKKRKKTNETGARSNAAGASQTRSTRNSQQNDGVDGETVSETSINQVKPKFQLPAKIPIKIPVDGWLSKSMSRMKVETEDENKESTVKQENIESSTWISSLKGGFEVRVMSVERIVSSFRNRSVDVTDAQETTTSNKKNFKAFVKKRNYRPQTTIVTTVPVYIGL